MSPVCDVQLHKADCSVVFKSTVYLGTHFRTTVKRPHHNKGYGRLSKFNAGDALFANSLFIILHHKLEKVISNKLLILSLLLELDCLVKLCCNANATQLKTFILVLVVIDCNEETMSEEGFYKLAFLVSQNANWCCQYDTLKPQEGTQLYCLHLVLCKQKGCLDMCLIQSTKFLLSRRALEMLVKHLIYLQEYYDQLISTFLFRAWYQHNLDHYSLDSFREPARIHLA